MSLIDEIRKPIKEELQIFRRNFTHTLSTDNPLLQNIIEYILEGTGKQLRPIMVLLAAKLCKGIVNDAAYHTALAIEFLHNASLIHDDVVDDTCERRGRSSINARWTNKIAVLSGDYLLAQSLISGARTRNLGIMDAIARIGSELSDGELLQLNKSQKSKISEEDYFAIVQKKTAILFSACTFTGGLSANANDEILERLKLFGEYTGICFQIKDDIFDYFEDLEIGKPTGNDLQDGKITLPLIYALANSTDAEKENIITIIDTKDFSSENIARIMRFAKEKGGVEYAVNKMNSLKQKAIEQLSIFPDSDVKNALSLCVEFATNRKN